MQKFLPITLLLIILSVAVSAQVPDYKFGRISDQELRMEAYEKDPAAPAVVLYENCNIYYDFNLNSGTIRQVREYTVRIKVLTTEGTSYGDVEIPYYEIPNVKEKVYGVTATSYHLENGKEVKNTLKRQDIFYEQISERWNRAKFAIPEVRPGSVIEYKYTLHSDRLEVIPDIQIQRSIPVVYSKSTVRMPEYFKFNVRTKGFYPLNVQRTSENKSRSGPGGGVLMYSEEVVQCEAFDIPALKGEPYVWCLNDFRSQLNFELSAYDFPGSLYRPVSQTWKAVNDLLAENGDFVRGLRMTNPYKEEVAAVLGAITDKTEQIRAIHRLILSKLSWNETYRLLPDSRRQVTREGTGSSADINFILMSALRDGGYDPVPILLNPRQFGRLPLMHPSIDKINAFVVGINLDDKLLVLDGTNKYSDINVLPSELSVDRARFYKINDDNAWVDLTGLSENQLQNVLMAKINPEGTLEGSITRVYVNQPGLNMKRKYARASSEEEYIESIENENGLTVGEYTVTHLDSPRTIEEFTFTKSLNQTGDRIYINASGLPFMSRNELTEQERMLPVEYNYPQNITINCAIDIPEGYEVEELPERINLSACDSGVRLTYVIQQNGNQIALRMIYQMNRSIFTTNEYTDLRTFMDMVVAKSGEQIVLKKI